MNAICLIETPFREKFGVPRQSLLVKEAWGKLRFPKNDFYSEAFRGLENFSHLWLIFEFHLVPLEDIKALVRPPRFQGKEKFGVFATRSPHRPNRLGLSVVKFERVEVKDKEIILHVSGVDLVNGTPIFDIKPYIPYADHIKDASAKYFSEAPKKVHVKWETETPLEKTLIEEVISLDPRPGQDYASDEEYGVSIAGLNVRFKKDGEEFVILKVTKE
jgi:tRNA-Thr(GGU) m(6)t(6)A37 methyltransferase TsaA